MISNRRFHEIVSSIHQPLEEPKLYQTIATQMCCAVGGECSGLIVYDWCSQSLRLVASCYTGNENHDTTFTATEGLTLRLGTQLEQATMMTRRHPWVVPDVKTEVMPEVERSLLLAVGLHSLLLVPIVHQGQLLGIVYVSHTNSCRLWTQAELELTQMLAQHAAIALHRTRQQAEIQRQAHREKALNQLQQRIRTFLDIDTRINTALAELLPLIDADWMIFAVESESSATALRITHYISRCESQRRSGESEIWAVPTPLGANNQHTSPWGDFTAPEELLTLPFIQHGNKLEFEPNCASLAKVLLSQTLQIIHNTQTPELESNCRACFQQHHVGALISIPVIYQEAILGHLWAIKHQPLAWNSDDIVALEIVCEQLGIAITQAQVHQQTREQAAATSLHARQLATALEEKTQLIASLHATQAHLIQSEKMSSLGELVAGVAHEINNPMNFIYGNIPFVAHYAKELLDLLNLYQTYYPQPRQEILQRAEDMDLEFVTTDLMRILDSMHHGSQRVREIVLTLRNFSRLDEADKKWVDLHEGIESTLVLLGHHLKHRIQVVKQYGELPPVECYPSQLNQVFMNVLTNAIDAINHHKIGHRPPSNGLITITTELVATEEPALQRVQIRIADNGMGIEPELHSRIFNPFFTTKEVGSGSGLGLAIAYKIIVEQHQGKICFNTTPGSGTEFALELPIRQPH